MFGRLTLKILIVLSVPAAAQFGGFSFWQYKPSYFVLTDTIYNGNLGGIAGANNLCFQELRDRPWKGKETVQFDASHVRAFICDNSTCNNLKPNRRYFFAVANTGYGGASFVTDASGVGPQDSTAWGSSSMYFNALANYFWSGRTLGSSTLWGTTPTGQSCSNWTVSSGGGNKGDGGDPDLAGVGRWNDSNPATCNTTLSLLCVVDP